MPPARRQTPSRTQPARPPANRAERRRARGADSPGMRVEVDGRVYEVRQTDMTPRLVAELRRETGFAGFVGVMRETERGFDIDVLAALVWLARRIEGELVAYDTVLDEMSYESEVDIQVVDERKRAVTPAGGDAAEGDSPEA